MQPGRQGKLHHHAWWLPANIIHSRTQVDLSVAAVGLACAGNLCLRKQPANGIGGRRFPGGPRTSILPGARGGRDRRSAQAHLFRAHYPQSIGQLPCKRSRAFCRFAWFGQPDIKLLVRRRHACRAWRAERQPRMGVISLAIRQRNTGTPKCPHHRAHQLLVGQEPHPVHHFIRQSVQPFHHLVIILFSRFPVNCVHQMAFYQRFSVNFDSIPHCVV